MDRTYKYLGTITALFVAVLLVSNIASTKIVQFGAFALDGGIIVFPLAYIFADILTEVYGFPRSRRVIWLGFFCALAMSVILYIVQILPPAPEWGNQAAFEAILGQAPRIVVASLIAYLCGEFVNSFILAKMKVWMGGKRLWARTIGSTLVGQAVDTAIFISIAFAGILPGSLLVSLIITNYIAKTLIEALFTPITYKVTNFLKKAEGEDYFDRSTDFNPFSTRA